MWDIEKLEEFGFDFEPESNYFTYCFPPPYYAKKNGLDTIPWSFQKDIRNTGYSLYLHIPFCEIDCSFCSLHRTLFKNDNYLINYIKALKNEIVSVSKLFGNNQIDAIYIGGGTPSILSSETIIDLFQHIKKYFIVKKTTEVCIEVAPSVNRKLKEWIEFINSLKDNSIIPLTRISFGVQSFDNMTLKKMGRNGGLSAVQDLLLAINQTITNYNIDLLLGYPERQSGISTVETVEIIKDSLSQMWSNEIPIPSISIYQLWDSSSIRVRKDQRNVLPFKIDILNAKWSLQNYLFNHGYMPGVVSSLIRGKVFINKWMQARHINFNNIGLGSGAYSILPKSFIYRERDIKGYINHFLFEQNTIIDKIFLLDVNELELRSFIMGLRTFEFIPKPNYELLNSNIRKDIYNKIELLIDLGILIEQKEQIKLNDTAFLISNEISSYLHPITHPRKILV